MCSTFFFSLGRKRSVDAGWPRFMKSKSRLHAIFPVHQSSMVVSKHKVIKVALLITTRIHEKVHVSTISCVSNALVQRTLRSITLMGVDTYPAISRSSAPRVLWIFEFDLVLTPTLLRPIHFTIHLTFRLHAKPDLPKSSSSPLPSMTMGTAAHSGEVLPGAINRRSSPELLRSMRIIGR